VAEKKFTIEEHRKRIREKVQKLTQQPLTPNDLLPRILERARLRRKPKI